MATIILSRLRALITEVFASEMPALGICFGHQLIAQMRGGCVMNDSGQKKAGSYEVNLTSEGKCDPLLESMPHSFVAQYGHRDSVTELPDGAVVLTLREFGVHISVPSGGRAIRIRRALEDGRLLARGRRSRIRHPRFSGSVPADTAFRRKDSICELTVGVI